MRFPLKSAAAALIATLFHTGALAADLSAPYSPPQNDDCQLNSAQAGTFAATLPSRAKTSRCSRPI